MNDLLAVDFGGSVWSAHDGQWRCIHPQADTSREQCSYDGLVADYGPVTFYVPEAGQDEGLPGVQLRYEAGVGIRPPRKGGKVRGVAREVEDGGGMELWHCDHDHAPGVRDCRLLTSKQRADAQACAEAWLRKRVAKDLTAGLPATPITRDE